MKSFFPEIDLANLYTKVCFGYMIAMLNFYSYGIRFAGPALRISDLFVLILVVIGILLGIERKVINGYFKILALIVGPFLFLEMTLPIIGLFVYSYGHIFNGPRIAFLYLPLTFIALFFRKDELKELNRLFEVALKWTIGLNLVFGILQLLAIYDIVPRQVLLQYHLQHFAVDGHFRVFDGIRVSGLRSTSTALSMVGIVGLSHFIAKILKKSIIKDWIFLLLSILIILLTASRVAILLLPILIGASLLIAPINKKRKGKLFLMILGGFSGILFALNLTGEFDRMFARIFRLFNDFSNDVSMNTRNNLWSRALERSSDFPYGTLSPPTLSIGLIDSGYLTYYLQGRWLFISTLLLFLGGAFFFSVRAVFKKKGDFHTNIFFMNIIIYTSVAMIFFNSVRSATVIFALLLGLINTLSNSNIELNVDEGT